MYEKKAIDSFRGTASKLTKGTELAVAFAQYAIDDESQNGKVFYGTLPEWIYGIDEGKYIDWQGNTISVEDLKP